MYNAYLKTLADQYILSVNTLYSLIQYLHLYLRTIFAFKLIKSVRTVCCPIQTQEVHERISLVVIAECE